MKTKLGWKITRETPFTNRWRTLYKGLHGTRTLPTGTWLTAERKRAREGSGIVYETGWHVLPVGTDSVQKYLRRFRATDGLLLSLVAYRGGWKKPGKTDVWLAEKMLVTLHCIEFETALRTDLGCFLHSLAATISYYHE